MASNAIPSDGVPAKPAARGETSDLFHALYKVAEVIASLRLTVALFVLAITIIFIGTLAQVDKDMWDVIHDYFHSWIAFIEFKVFFPRSFFPMGADWVESLPVSGFYFPGGALIGMAMGINLVFAHLIRFKVQARGMRLLWGLVATFIGGVLTFLVIASGHNQGGLQAEPFFAWPTLWLLMKIGLVLLWLATGFTLLTLDNKRVIEKIGLGLFAVILGGVLVYLFFKGADASLGESSLRILWQLIQGGMAGVVLLVGTLLLFKYRGGVVLLHAGIGLMMFGELFVSLYAVEARMTLTEGESANFLRDIRATELAIVDNSPEDHQAVTAIPRARLLSSAKHNAPIVDDQLPFSIQVVHYYRNSKLRDVEAKDENPATKGAGLSVVADNIRPGSGTDSDGAVDMAAAYVRFVERQSGKDLGTLLVSNQMASQDHAEQITAGGKTYDVFLRFKRLYRSYTIGLMDVRKDDYLGTNTPRNYSSDIRLVDASRKVDRKLRIWMNNPLRFAGETFYQSGYDRLRDGTELTTLQVVTNTGWMIPYVSCMLVVVGMCAHFVVTLLRFLGRHQRSDLFRSESEEREAEAAAQAEEAEAEAAHAQAADAQGARSTGEKGKRRKRGNMTSDEIRRLRRPATPAAPVRRPRAWYEHPGVAWGIPAVIVLFCGLWLLSKARVPGEATDEFHFYQFGKLPVVYQGRTKPIDTLARNTLRVISDRQEFTDVDGNKQPAVRWLLDLATDRDEAMKHRVVRIENLDVLETLGLARRKGFRYGIEEFSGKLDELQKAAEHARGLPAEQLTVYDRKVLELERRLRAFQVVRDSFRAMPFPKFPTEEEFNTNREETIEKIGMIRRMLDAVPQANAMLERMQPPRVVPMLEPGLNEKPWEAFAVAANQSYINAIKEQPVNEPTTAVARILQAYRDDDVEEFNEAVADYQHLLGKNPEVASAGRINFEAFFNHFQPFYYSAPLYLIAFLLAAASSVGYKPLNRAALGLILVTFVVHTFALIGRMYISGRPPVTNLYSSAVFIGWGCVLAGVGLELLTLARIRVGNIVAAVAGFSTLIIAHFLSGDGDTFTVLQAVLDTQFWLATHVTCITLGYSATFLAGLLGVIYIVVHRAGALGGIPLEEERKVIGWMTYGMLCFAIFFSFFGTVLGGLWADDSWGRFWGWDPKENGALMIVLWNALVLHAAWGKLVRHRGLALLAIGGNIITAWSWFGVNELGVGLHSYGFTEGVLRTLGLFVVSQLVLIGIGLIPGNPPPAPPRGRDPMVAEVG